MLYVLTFSYTYSFHVSAFWLEVAYLGPNFDIFGVNRGHI